ncbi:PREDICTED: phosphatidylglycerol/phosphatidylinositol transfer protein-like isoform X1 [Amphimedon queenslandica]|uniref:MD-2-related lipid-recognition domain-containing protein n=1 Tax=Amphimedon queenslandica TaxID=400682 RepID=A0AAN0J8Z1_AMPQE|nr:PREDICTED: phosphatidylglycerol/phosphatidylinositol transfer protein-like isoform X1 [Amphimedon queenslandica]|eukprot:XP_019853217.1 PREDICTED: phosphatidylglycerol/phosphatidylinositol transfer protein-like isoform X1 [Amphimedon queenslandica]
MYTTTHISKIVVRKKMSVLLMILSVVLVVSTLTGSTNNYYNEPTDNNGSLTDCSVTKKFVEFNLSVTPYPLKRGVEFHWQGVVKIKRTIHWGIVHATATYNYRGYTNITFLDDKFNLCDFLDDIIKEYCPIQPGIYHINTPSRLPNILWPGQYYFKGTAYNEKGEQIMCIMKQVTIE